MSGRLIAVISTEESDGSSYLSAVWYEFFDGAFHVPTAGTSRKARNAVARPRGSIAVDERGGGCRGVAARGAIEVVGGEEAMRLNERIHRRYVTDAGMGDPELGGLLAGADDVTLRLVPEKWHGWDMGDAFGGRLSDPRLAYPPAP